MLISSVYPLKKTFSAESFEEVITMEMLQSLELVLQSALTLDAFEKSIEKHKSKDASGYEILQLWLKCENFIHKETFELREEILDSAKALKFVAKNPLAIKNEAFNRLNQKFFKIFQESEEYRELLHDVTKQQIYMNRILRTSLAGNPNEMLISVNR